MKSVRNQLENVKGSRQQMVVLPANQHYGYSPICPMVRVALGGRASKQ